ncbi:FAD-dependent oxidoreductase [Microbacterium sp. MEC084]|uniref:FAD-dependent oxidoreductase n=1 Tax=Microbacterium sp. MEC084 TaxID=1963027 RepID=UPI00106F786C|nr:FAD-dependent oxidoreductase [Microbacterium sp. MEC084]MCD1268022.1 FAD-dependent oxidoreductase [Microbacterium sp. MEC084]
MTERIETVVIGGGLMGSAAAWQLARRGREVLLLERFEQLHHHGASHGATRNFNVGYTQPHYLELVTEAGRLWRELESESGADILDLVGQTNHGKGVPDDHADILRAHGIAAEWLAVDEARERWRGIAFDTKVLYTPDGGRLNPERAIAAFQAVAVERGGRVRHGARVLRIGETSGGAVEVVTEGETYLAEQVIVTVGGWTDKLVGGLVSYPRLIVTQEQPAHFAVTDHEADWPSFNHVRALGDPQYDYWHSNIYGMLTPGEGVKAGWHAVGPHVDPDDRSYEYEPKMMEHLRRYAREYLIGTDPDRFAAVSCTYTTTPDEAFVLDRRGPLILGAGFSGQGAKFTPAIGRVLADFVTEPEAKPIPAFAADRFGTAVKGW